MNLFKRLGSMLLDHFIMCLVSAVIVIPLFLITFFTQRYFNVQSSWIIGVVVFIIYFNKDFFRGKSPAKRILGLQVISKKDNKPASRIRCFLRNLTIVLWPIEVVITLFSRQRRLGDLIAGTKVIEAEKESVDTILKEIKKLPNN
jgi:uncharacterized RDD family membrane protein YckC